LRTADIPVSIPDLLEPKLRVAVDFPLMFHLGNGIAQKTARRPELALQPGQRVRTASGIQRGQSQPERAAEPSPGRWQPRGRGTFFNHPDNLSFRPADFFLVDVDFAHQAFKPLS